MLPGYTAFSPAAFSKLLFLIPKRIREDKRLSKGARATGRGSRPNQWPWANLAQPEQEAASNGHARKLAWELGSCSQRQTGWGRSKQNAVSQSSQDRRLGPGPAFPRDQAFLKGLHFKSRTPVALPSLPCLRLLLNGSAFLSFCPFGSSF